MLIGRFNDSLNVKFMHRWLFILDFKDMVNNNGFSKTEQKYVLAVYFTSKIKVMNLPVPFSRIYGIILRKGMIKFPPIIMFNSQNHLNYV